MEHWFSANIWLKICLYFESKYFPLFMLLFTNNFKLFNLKNTLIITYGGNDNFLLFSVWKMVVHKTADYVIL